MRSTMGWNKVLIMLALVAVERPAWAQSDGVPPAVGAANALGQAPSARARAYSALSNGINNYRKKEYESAARLFLEAQRGQDYLSPQHRQELSRYVLLNKTALQSQREGLDLLKKAEDAVKDGRVQEADRLLKLLEGNQFLSAGDRQKAQQLGSSLRPVSAVINDKQPDKVAQITLARAKLSQARQLLNKGDFKTAETIAIEVAKMPNTYYDPNEDTPKKVLDDIAGVKKDGKALLRMARTALSRGDIDRADELARLAKEVGAGRRLFNIFGDTPEKLLRDIEDARLQKPGSVVPKDGPVKEAQQNNERPSRFEVFRNLNPFSRGTPETPVVEEPKPEVAPKDQSRRFPLLPAFLTGRKSEEAEDAIETVSAEEGKLRSPYGLSKLPEPPTSKLPEPPAMAKLPEPPGSLKGRLPEPPSSQRDRPTSIAKLPEPPSSRDQLPEPPPRNLGRQPQVPTRTASRLPEAPSSRNKLPEAPASASNKLPEAPEQVAQRTRPKVSPFSGRRIEDVNGKPGKLPEPPPQVAARTRAEGSAQQLLDSAREALKKGDTAKAKMLVARARSLNVSYNWWDETPEKVAADIARAEATGGKPGAIAQVSNPPRQGNTAPKADDKKYTRDDIKKMIADARKQLRSAKLDEAEQLAVKARTLAPTGWGLFEDSPDKLVQDIQKARVRQNKAESVRLLAEARQLLDKGQLDDAKTKALKAERLHGPYSIWDFGDRPQKLITEIEVARAKDRKSKPGKVDDHQGTSPYHGHQPAEDKEGIQLAEARKLLDRARQAIDKGDFDTALKLAGSVERMGFQPNKPDEISPAFIRKQVELAQNKGSSKKQAQTLIAQARDLQRDGKLLEARQKILDAQNLNATFLPDEERPEKVLLDLAAVAIKRIEYHTQRAADQMAMSGVDHNALRRAEDDLTLARELAAGFALDTQPIDQKLAALQQARNSAAIANVFPNQQPPAVTPPASAPGQATVADPIPGAGISETQEPTPAQPTAQQQGMELLNKARLEIRQGHMVEARHLVEEVCKGPYGLKDAAQQLLRSIDAEEQYQRVKMANRFFDAMKSAYIRGDTVQAAAIGKSIEMRYLQKENLERFKEIMNTPTMQQALARADGPAPDPNVKPVGTGRATASDLDPPQPQQLKPAESYAQQVAAMQEIKFQKMRDESLAAQREAIERFRAGASEEALELLKRYLLSLEETGLDPSRVAMLRKPVEARLEQFKALKVQQDLASLRDREGKTAQAVREQLTKAEKMKNEGVAKLMGEYKQFYKEGKYREAQMAAMKAHELDPDNV
ncbi:MAG: hypothetical protein AB7K24_10770, partial [Gemmataceae bacterium]